MGSLCQSVFAMRPHILMSITSLASASIVTDRSSLPEGAWMPKELGRFHIPHAGFIEVYDNEEGKKDLYITTFNPALPYFHDPVYMIPSPGEKLNSVTGWADEVVTLGVKASAYWPNFPVKLPKEVVGFEGVVQTSGFLVPGKNTGKLELYNRNDNARGPIDIAAGQDKDWSYHWVIWKDVDDDGLIDAHCSLQGSRLHRGRRPNLAASLVQEPRRRRPIHRTRVALAELHPAHWRT